MAKYLLIESRDPWESSDVSSWQTLAADLARQGDEVIYFLVQNGVLPARRSAQTAPLAELASAGVDVRADEFSLRERGIGTDRLAEFVTAAPLDVVIDCMAEGRKVIWH